MSRRVRRPLAAGFVWITLLFPPALAAETPGMAVVDGGEARWRGPDGPLPFTTAEEIEAFLSSAPIVSRQELTGGTNRPLKVRLEQDGVAANAIFRIVDIQRRQARLDGKFVANFHDSYVYECAAYEVSRLLGLDRVPPCVRRRYEKTSGTLQLWVEDAMTETDRRRSGKKPPRKLRWLRQKQTMHLFDALIYNFDRNQGNMLIDSDWKLWFIDHTRSFRKSTAIERIERIHWCEHGVWERLRTLDKQLLSARLKSLASPMQIDSLLKRRDKLLRHLQARIAEVGQGGVLFDASDSGEASLAGLAELAVDEDIPETSSRLEVQPDRR